MNSGKVEYARSPVQNATPPPHTLLFRANSNPSVMSELALMKWLGRWSASGVPVKKSDFCSVAVVQGIAYH